MPILRHEHTSNFTIVPNGLLRDPGLSLRDVGLLCVMLSLPDEWEFSIKGLESIFSHDGREAVCTSLNRIESAGYLRRDRQRDKTGKIGPVIWSVSDVPGPCTAQPDAVQPDTVLPDTVNPPQRKNPLDKVPTDKEQRSHARHLFSPPSVQDVEDYVAEKGYHIDAELFVAHYEANGWVQSSGRPIRNWKAAVVTWAKNEARFGNGQTDHSADIAAAKRRFYGEEEEIC